MATPPKIAQLPEPPVRSDAPVNFSSKADAFLGAFPNFRTQANALADFLEGRATDAANSATAANSSKTAAQSSATAAANSASSAAGIASSTAATIRSEVSSDLQAAQTAASNASGSASSAAASASSASGSATAAGQSAAAALADANRAQAAADYVGGMTDGAAPLNSPNFTGTPTAPTPAAGDNSTKLATTAWVRGFAATASVSTAAQLTTARTINGTSFNGTANITTANWGTARSLQVSLAKNTATSVNGSANVTDIGVTGTLPLANGGTGATTAAAARTQLGLGTAATASIASTTGTSTTAVMSQKATTDAIEAASSGPRPTKDHGAVATSGSQTVVCNVQESDFHIMSMATANTTGTLTIDFANMPAMAGKHFSWHVQIQRGGIKAVAFAQTITWAGGVAPVLGKKAANYDLLMFYKVGSEPIRGMQVDAY